VRVLEDRSGDSTKTIRLAVAVYHSTSQNPASDPVIFLDGGPGSETLKSSASAFTHLIRPILNNRDFIAFDQRGAGASKPSLDCEELKKVYLEDLQQLIPSNNREGDFTNAVLACRQRLAGEGIHLAAYISQSSAEDVKDVLTALGYDQANLYAVSYGTYVAQLVMRENPELVRSAVLDSVVPLDIGLYSEKTTTSEEALRIFFDDCTTDSECHRKYPNLEKDFRDLVQKLNTKPLTLAVQVPGGERYQYIDTEVRGDDLIEAFMWGTRASALIAEMPRAIYQFKNGDYSLVRYTYGLPATLYDNLSLGKFITAHCHEQILAATPAELNSALAESSPNLLKLSYFFGSADSLTMICNMWRTKPLGPDDKAPLESAIPTLILSGKYDSLTPPAFAHHLAETLSHVYLYEIPGHGHAPSLDKNSPCPINVITAFIGNPENEPSHVCIDTEIAHFHKPYNGQPPVEFTHYSDPDNIFTANIPEGWIDTNDGFFYRVNSFLDITTLGVQSAEFPASDWIDYLRWSFNSYSGFESKPVKIGTVDANGLTWTLYKTTSLGYPVEFAVAQKDEKRSYLVILMSMDEEDEVMLKAVLLPVIESFKPAP
jgi:pimeloyl-ACP methyl ester carboxylesterase